jgi:hypothetical protein
MTLVMAFVIGGCDNQGAQEDFIDEAGLPASGITRILDNAYGGEICSEDADDWRTSPIYSGIVLVERPASPNPVAGSALVTITIRELQFDRVRGILDLRAFGNGNTLLRLDTIIEASSPGEYVFQFSPSILSENGLHRLFIFDGIGELVSYGDIELVANQPTTC